MSPMSNGTVNTSPQNVAVAPQIPAAGVAGFAWAGIVVAAGGSLTFNIYHDSHSLKELLLALVAGFLPPFLSSILAHVAVALDSGKLTKAWIFLVTAGAMFVSAFASSQVLAPAYGLAVGIVFSLVIDAASMTCLLVLLRIYAARAAYRRWEQGQNAGTTATDQNHAADGSGNHGDPRGSGARTIPARGSGTITPNHVMVPGTTATPVTATVGDGSEPSVAGSGGAQKTAPKPAARHAAPIETRSAPVPRPADDAEAERIRKLRAEVTEDLASRERPGLESAEQKERAVLAILAEFRQRTGLRMNNRELGKALRMNKGATGVLREDLRDRELAQEGDAA
jgi:hypothetical protein